ncbi:hypothetical protein ES288_D05G444000v1 [Gossypium darwinii]|uniref:R13L1/DRL21-like LRR repeat region domain-containing protein n=1 Tax=Gossypium darwinii TaxID=34276 RepID=A0A5D2CV60_GOSDA|nr:hypothetical protein ES288_D05G444000v1 [Gossypium darwinii]
MGCRLGELYKENEVEERVLDFLRPPKKLEQLIIENYGGNLSSLKLRNCKNYKSLPSIGRFPLLKDLSIIGFDQVQKIGVELFRENQLNPFASLEILSFQSLPNWEEWDTCEGDEKVLKLPSLRELSIKTCPQLLGRLPTHLPSFLVVSISSFLLLCKFSIRGCAELVDDCSSTAKDLSSLQTMTMLRFGNSEHFEIDGWEELASLSRYGFSLVGYRFISVWRCPQLQYLEAEEAELQPDKISCVESLLIYDCERLNRLPQVLHELIFPTVMEIGNCRSLVSFAENNLPPNLKKLRMRNCENLEYLVDEKEDNICNQFQLLQITECSKLSCLFSNTKFPITLKHLIIRECPESGIKSLPRELDKLKQLQEIWLLSCSNLVSFEESGLLTTSFRDFVGAHCMGDISFPLEGFPANLASLAISNAPKIYRSLVEWGLNRLTSLQELIIRGVGCSNVVSFTEEGTGMMLPPSLTRIILLEFENLEYMSSKGFQDLASLKELDIGKCPKLTSLPEKDVLLSLGYLHIYRYLFLKEECSSDKGREWSKISHIPLVEIDGKIVIPRELD